MIKPLVFTYCSDLNHPGFLRMRRSCEAWGWTLDVQHGPWRGDIHRWSVFREQLPKWREAQYTHVLALDAMDVVAVGGPDDLRPKLAYYNDPAILVAAEAAIWPSGYRAADWSERTSHWYYAHSQIVVDLRQTLPENFLQFNPEHNCDQQHFADLVLEGSSHMRIDRRCEVIQSLAHAAPWQDWFKIVDGQLWNIHTGSRPLFAHGNGQTPMEWLDPLPHAIVNN